MKREAKAQKLEMADVKAKFSAWPAVHWILFVMSLTICAVVNARLKTEYSMTVEKHRKPHPVNRCRLTVNRISIGP